MEHNYDLSILVADCCKTFPWEPFIVHNGRVKMKESTKLSNNNTRVIDRLLALIFSKTNLSVKWNGKRICLSPFINTDLFHAWNVSLMCDMAPSFFDMPLFQSLSISVRLLIAFITWNSNLVPLLEGLCRSNPCRFEFSVFGVLPESNRRPRDWQSRALTNWASFTSSRKNSLCDIFINVHLISSVSVYDAIFCNRALVSTTAPYHMVLQIILEIIFDLPFGFPINNIISLCVF